MALLVEWGEQHAEALGPDRLLLSIQLGPRRVALRASGPRSEALRASVLSSLAGSVPTEASDGAP